MEKENLYTESQVRDIVHIAFEEVIGHHYYEAGVSTAIGYALESQNPWQPNDLNSYARQSHRYNEKWWYDENGQKLERNKGEMLMLIVSEISEAMEGERKDLMDDKLPHRKMAEVELVDALIRIFDYAHAYGYDLEGAYLEKSAYNQTREDHSYEARNQANGKKW